MSWLQSRLARIKTRFASEPKVLPMNTGHQNTFKLLTADTNKIIARSQVRIPKDIPNIRALSLIPGWTPEPESELAQIDPQHVKKLAETTTHTADPDCNEMRGVNYRQMVSKAMHKDLIPVRWNDVR